MKRFVIGSLKSDFRSFKCKNSPILCTQLVARALALPFWSLTRENSLYQNLTLDDISFCAKKWINPRVVDSSIGGQNGARNWPIKKSTYFYLPSLEWFKVWALLTWLLSCQPLRNALDSNLKKLRGFTVAMKSVRFASSFFCPLLVVLKDGHCSWDYLSCCLLWVCSS